MHLTDQDKQTLHDIARAAIETAVRGTQPPDVTIPDGTLREKCGAFVSLHRRGALRGCIGYIQAVKPLAETVRDMAQAAAMQDPRFDPLTERELEDLDIEISVLSPLQPVGDLNDIQVGTHGLMVVRGRYSGLLLPQVATQYGWDRTSFLEHTCMKAGLPPDAWKDPETKIYLFSADVF